MFQIGDRVKCIDGSPVRHPEFAPPVHEGREYIVHGLHNTHCDKGDVGISIGLDWLKKPDYLECPSCSHLSLPSEMPFYRASRFVKVEPEYRVIEVAESILEQAKKLLTPETIAQ